MRLVRARLACAGALFVVCLAHAGTGWAQTPPPAAAAGMTIEQLLKVDVQRVTGASRFAQDAIDAPASVTIITHEEIFTFGYRTLADILRSVRGFYVTDDRNYSYLGVRGFSRPGDYNTRVLLLVDGHRMNDNVYDQAAIGTDFPLDLDLVDHIEVIRGPASSLYGTSAFFGVINVVTVRPTAASRTFGAVEAGSQRTVEVRGGVSGASDGTEALLAVTGYRTSGQARIVFPSGGPAPAGAVSTGADGDNSWNVFASARRGGWSGEVAWGTRTKEIPTGAWATTLSNPGNGTTDDRGFASVNYDGAWKRASVSWQGSYDRYRYDGTYVPLEGQPYSDFGYGDWVSSDVALSAPLSGRHVLTGGAEMRVNLRQDQGTDYSDQASFSAAHRSTTWAIFAEDQFRVSSKVLLQIGLRHDDLDPVMDAVSPRLALILKPRPTEAVKVLLGEAFRAPNAYELYYYTNGVPAPLSGERIRSAELVWERYVARRARVAASAFLSQTRDLITEVANDTPEGIGFENRGRTRAAGFGLEAETALPGGLHALGSYTYAQAREEGSAAPLSNSPRHLVQARLAIPLGRSGLLAGVEQVFVGHRFALDGTTVPPSVLSNVTVSRRELLHGFGIGVDVKNVFNRVNMDPGNEEHPFSMLPQNGRTVRARITWQF